MEKDLFKYSKACTPIKILPSRTVTTWEIYPSFINPWEKQWWAQVRVRPLNKRRPVFNRGMWRATLVSPRGGQSPVHGASLLWKNVQKNLKKKSTSEVINNINPNRRLLFTWSENRPLALSLIRSYIHAQIPTVSRSADIYSRDKWLCIIDSKQPNRESINTPHQAGQGLMLIW